MIDFNTLLDESEEGPGIQGQPGHTDREELDMSSGAGPTGTASETADESCSSCGTAGASSAQPQLIYAIGQPGCDLVSESRKNSLSQHMAATQFADNPDHLLSFIQENPWESESIEWTLNMGATPVYSIRPLGAYAGDAYGRLRQNVRDYLDGQIERISIAGVIVGQTQLLSGQVVPVVKPELRCCYTWTTGALVDSVAGNAPNDKASEKDRATYSGRVDGVRNFLERVYEDFRNLGISPQERALNVAATNAMNAAGIFESAIRGDMQLDTVGVERSPICPPGSDCWDVLLTFFNPTHQLEQARRQYRFTVDVADVCPVMVGNVRTWFVR